MIKNRKIEKAVTDLEIAIDSIIAEYDDQTQELQEYITNLKASCDHYKTYTSDDVFSILEAIHQFIIKQRSNASHNQKDV